MNLNEERNYQMLLDTLDAMGLSGANRQLAEEYLEPGQAGDESLLAKMEFQDLSLLDQERRGRCKSYLEHCLKRKRMEEYRRFVQLAVAVGGSTAHDVLLLYGCNLGQLKEYLTSEQAMAILAEGALQFDFMFHAERMAERFYRPGRRNPQVLLHARELCRGKDGQAKVLLSAVYLYCVKPEKPQGGFLKNLFSREGDKGEQKVQEVVEFLENFQEESISDLFAGGQLLGGDLEAVKDFLFKSYPDTPMEGLLPILQGKQCPEQQLKFLARTAFLSLRHSKRSIALVRLCMALNLGKTLEACQNIGESSWFADNMKELEEGLPVPLAEYVLWCVKHKCSGALRRMAAKHPGTIEQVAARLTVQEYTFLLSNVSVGNQQLFRKMEASYNKDFQMKAAREISSAQTGAAKEVLQYLLGEAEIETLYLCVEKLREGWDYRSQLRAGMIHKLKDQEDKTMYHRALVVEGLGQRAYYFWNYCVTDRKKSHREGLDRQEIGAILDAFDQEHMEISYQMEALAGIYDAYYSESSKTRFMNECVQVLARRRETWKETLEERAIKGSLTCRLLSIRVLDIFWDSYKELLLSCASESAKQVRELLGTVYGSHREWEPEIKVMLGSKKSKEREMALLVLKKWGVDQYREELEAALEGEKSKKLREELLSLLGKKPEAEEAPVKARGLEEQAAEILKGGKKRKVSWALEIPFAPLHKKDGALAGEDLLPAILVAYADMGIPGVSPEAAGLARELNPRELAACMGLLFGKWLETGAEAKKKWVLYAVSIHGGEEIIPGLYHQIQEWPQNSRGAMAAEAVKALALNGSSQALLLVDQISRKFKFRQVKNAAGEALSYAAGQLGISREELEDRIVPNLGFDERMEQVYDYGSRSFRVVLSPALSLEVFDESGKKLKNLPAPGKRDEEEKAKAANEAFKQMKKQLKTVVTNQKLRLSQAISTERLWSPGKWQELFVKNPIMHQFAMGLIWGSYEEGDLKETFRYMEDGSFNTVDEEEYELPAGEKTWIGLVHPIELSPETLSAWKEQLEDYEVIQPVEQLERPVYSVEEEELTQKELTRFGGMLLNGLSLSGKLQGQGWYRGSVQDAGVYSTFYREDGPIGVELEFSGCYVGDENEEVTVYGAKFYRAGTVARGSYVYDTVKKKDIYALGEVSPRYFSEIVLQLTRATASSQEQLSYPECKDRR
ncbi:MAG: DUF4132 domain-containing protein [Lachnospiraceae bacterium]|nr:DUF4132 domain-containing protein [Lachnospiraceae bacterium]